MWNSCSRIAGCRGISGWRRTTRARDFPGRARDADGVPWVVGQARQMLDQYQFRTFGAGRVLRLLHIFGAHQPVCFVVGLNWTTRPLSQA
jgi:hypothetical protein